MRIAFALLLFASIAFAQDKEETSLFDHSGDSRVWLSGQINIIHQQNPDFFAKYSGPNSFIAEREKATSRVMTLYSGARVTQSTDILLDVESSGGQGLSQALGLAGFVNLDVVRNPTLGSTPYLARLMVHQTIALSEEKVKNDPTFLSLASEKPEKRIEIYAGKMAIPDFFDLNSVGTDSHLQFMNWTLDNNGGYDYAADTRGYTYGVVGAYQAPRWAVQFGEALMPKVANGLNLDWNVRRARAENLEFTIRPSIRAGNQITLRLLAYLNHANMGDYQEAINAFLNGQDPTPDITKHRKQGRLKDGFGLNFEKDFNDEIRLFSRAGWNEGHHESFAYTEVNNTISVGADLLGKRWHRPSDKVGLAFVANGISEQHARYLQLGGLGFLLGDGNLTYGHEKIIECYYTARIVRGVYAALDLQYITNPGYNRDRGPVFVPGVRLHLEF
jgi:high affinity Mn2+ porin